jgi:hypothetical protein
LGAEKRTAARIRVTWYPIPVNTADKVAHSPENWLKIRQLDGGSRRSILGPAAIEKKIDRIRGRSAAN